jgi:uncharacterized protein involved in exopolysaccharide biosynthesis/Mrp family chromosome partitioning ATPase
MKKEQIWIENIDLKSIFLRFVKAWPLFVLSFIFFILIAVLVILFSPEIYEAKTSIVIEKPQRFNDPNRLILGAQPYSEPEKYYFINEEVKLKSYPLIKQVVDSLQLFISYYKDELLINEEIYQPPFKVEIDKNENLENINFPIDNSFYCTFINNSDFLIESEGEFENGRTYKLSETVKLRQWINIEDFKFRIIENKVGKNLNEQSEFTEFSFVFNNPKSVALSYIDQINIKQEQLDATVFGIKLLGSPKDKVLDFLNVLSNTYIQNHLKEKGKIYDKALDYVNSELDNIILSLNANEEGLKQLKTEYGITNVNQKSEIILRQINIIETEKAKLLTKNQYITYLKEILSKEINDDKLSSPVAFGIDDPLLVNLTNDLLSLQIEKNTLEIEEKQDNPSYTLIVLKINMFKENINEIISGFEQSYNIQKTNLDKQLNDLNRQFGRLPKAEIELSKKTRFFKLDETLFKDLMEKKIELEITKVSIEPDFKIVEKAYISSIDPVFPDPKLIFVIAFLLAIICPIGFLVLKALFNDKISGIINLEFYKLDHSVYSIIKSNIKSTDDFVSYPQSKIVEDFNVLSFMIQSLGKNKFISMVSQTPLCGNSFITSFIAMSLAQRHNKVLIIDANLKKPNQFKFFNLELKNDFSDFLENKCQIDDAVSKTQFAGLYLMAYGKQTNTKINGLKQKLDDLKNQFDYIIVDNAALQVSIDTLEFIKQSDHSFIIARNNHSRPADIEEISNLFTKQAVNNFSLIFNDSPDRSLFKDSKDKYFVNKPLSIKERFKSILSI